MKRSIYPECTSSNEHNLIHTCSNMMKSIQSIVLQYIPFFKHIPGFNLIYDLFDEVPTLETTKEFINLLALIDALLLGVCVTFMTGIGYSDLEAANDRFLSSMILNNNTMTINEYHEYSIHHPEIFARKAPSTYYGFYCLLTVTGLALAVFIVVILYIDLVGKKFNGMTKKQNELLFQAWWKYGRYACVLAFGLTVVGAIGCMLITVRYVVLAFPDEIVEATGDRSTTSESSLYGMTEVATTLLYSVIIGICFLIGLGTRDKFLLDDIYAKEQERELTSSLMKESYAHWDQFFKQTDETIIYFAHYAEEYIELFQEMRFDFADRAYITDEQLQAMGIELPGHRVKLLKLFQLPVVPMKSKQIINLHDQNLKVRKEEDLTV